MASNSANEDVIKEGFLCPICLIDLGDISQLQNHFTHAHSSSGETSLDSNEKDFVLQFKGLFGKAKQRLLQFDALVNDKGVFDDLRKTSTSLPFEAQQLGAVQSHSSYFRKLRGSRIDQFTVDTNNLIIRLDKLVNQSPSDPVQRKEFERDVVPWKNDGDVKLCLSCKKKFGITRRRHHCRLCGSIMCNSCSKFLTFLVARRLTNPTGYEPPDSTTSDRQDDDPTANDGDSPVRRNAQRLMRNAERLTLSVLKRDGTDVSIGSLLNQEGEEHLRICELCKCLLSRRDEQMESRQQPAVIVQMYERLRSLIADASALYPSYCRMAQSLCSGESLYSLQAAKEMRLKMLKTQEQIDFTSKRILALGVEEKSPGDDAQPQTASTSKSNPKEFLLQRNIRSFAASFLQELILGVPNLPSEEEYVNLQKGYKEKLRIKIARERAEADLLADQRSLRPSTLSSSVSVPGQLGGGGGGRSTGGRRGHEWIESDHRQRGGWTADTHPTTLNPFGEQPDDDRQIDPLQQQVVIIKGYLRQAAEAGRMEEVAMLEQNLRELQEELKLQHVETPRTPLG